MGLLEGDGVLEPPGQRSVNPAVTLAFRLMGIYWIGPIVGMLLAVLACSFLAKRIEVARLYYFESDNDRLFRRI